MGNAGERRLHRRYKIGLAIRFRVSEGRTLSKWRVGRTCDMSTGGVIFRCGQPLPVNAHIEMVIDWPSKQGNLYPICLRAAGHVVRRHGRMMAVRMTFCQMFIEKAASPPGVAASTGA